MDNKPLDYLSKALMAVGLGYLIHIIATMPKAVQTEIGTLAGLGDTDTIKKIAGSIGGDGEQKEDTQEDEPPRERARGIEHGIDEEDTKFIPQEKEENC